MVTLHYPARGAVLARPITYNLRKWAKISIFKGLNRLPLEIRQIVSPIEFRREVIIHFWELVSEEDGSDAIDDSLDDGIT